MGSYLDTV